MFQPAAAKQEVFQPAAAKQEVFQKLGDVASKYQKLVSSGELWYKAVDNSPPWRQCVVEFLTIGAESFQSNFHNLRTRNNFLKESTNQAEQKHSPK